MILSAGCCTAVAAFAPFAAARARVAGFVGLPRMPALAPPRREVERRRPLGRVEMIWRCDVDGQRTAVAWTAGETNLVKGLVHCIELDVNGMQVLGEDTG